MLEPIMTSANNKREQFLEQLKEFLRIPSISTLPEHKPDIENCAKWLANELDKLNLDNVAIIPTDGHPVVYGEWLHATDKPTVLVYAHYDVQPVDPLYEWLSPPFEPDVRGDYLYARGASDMKGQIFAFLKAMECWVGEYPLNIKFLIEGEEEIESQHLDAFIDDHREKLKCDFVLNCDSGIFAPDSPGIIYGVRGLANFEIELRSTQRDLHSGLFGGIIRNPIQTLSTLIAKMHDENGRILLPGFYDFISHTDEREQAILSDAVWSDEQWLKMSTASALHGEKEYSVQERLSIRPSLDVIGIWGGYIGEGSKNIIPATASAKISMRLVEGQEHKKVEAQLKTFFDKNTPKDTEITLHTLGAGGGAVMDRNSVYMQAAMTALRTVFQKEPKFTRLGFSVPVIGMLQEKMNVDTILLGFALPDDGIHGPNERLYLPNFFKGIDTYIQFLVQFKKMQHSLL